MKERKIKAIFEVSEKSNITGVSFKCGGKTIEWNELTSMEQIRMLNAWAAHCELFTQFIKDDYDPERKDNASDDVRTEHT